MYNCRVLTNISPRGIVSEAMVMCASTPDKVSPSQSHYLSNLSVSLPL